MHAKLSLQSNKSKKNKLKLIKKKHSLKQGLSHEIKSCPQWNISLIQSTFYSSAKKQRNLWYNHIWWNNRDPKYNLTDRPAILSSFQSITLFRLRQSSGRVNFLTVSTDRPLRQAEWWSLKAAWVEKSELGYKIR